jgi:hypothetical protein
MKNLLLTLVCISILINSGCNEENLCLRGSGTVRNYELNVDSFDEISLIGPVNLRIKQGNTPSLNVDAEPEMFSELSYSVKNGLLEIGYKDNVTCFETNHGVWINATVPDIRMIEQSGEGDIISDGLLSLSQLMIRTSGIANISLSGQVDQQMIESSGIVTVQNFNFSTRQTSIEVSGTGDIEVSCTEKLDIDVDGSAVIYYVGNPTITQKSSGSIEIVDAN